jgi:leucyl/phenylalanyl-tRNA---protein transferase
VDSQRWSPRDTARRRVPRRSPVAADGRTRAPHPVGPTAWVLPGPEDADEDGVVGIGADLAATTLVDAYRRGIFPWPHPGMPLPWFSPDPRAVIATDGVRVSRSLRRTLRRSGWTTTVDAAFAEVVAGCAGSRPDGTWITAGMARAYQRLHELGWAHSLEVWAADRLIGGLYGVQAGGVFTGESMFHRVPDASKVAMLDLAARLGEAGGTLLDVQVATPHLCSMGAVEVSRDDYLAVLAAVRDDPVRLWTREEPVARLARRAASVAEPAPGSVATPGS